MHKRACTNLNLDYLSTQSNNPPNQNTNMSHGIEKQDIVFSTKDTEWHGLARKVDAIGDTEIAEISFPIIQGKMTAIVDGQEVKMNGHKVIIADLRHRLDLPESDRLLPLHVPKDSYTPISNGDCFDMAKTLASNLGFDIVTAGTLEGCKKFFISLDTGDSELKIKANGTEEKVLAFIDIVTSHDGTLAQETYDSMTRIVCMNTFRWSRSSKGGLNAKVYHTKNAKSNMEALAERISEIIAGRAEYVSTMERLATVPMTKDEALYIPLAYFGRNNSPEKENVISTRSFHAAEGIQNLFMRGLGNGGKTAYDLVNGATEYWTSGDGTGLKADNTTKLFKGRFGAAADHKTDFVGYVDGISTDRAETVEIGRKLYVEFMQDA